jgi:hypothetical protein
MIGLLAWRTSDDQCPCLGEDLSRIRISWTAILLFRVDQIPKEVLSVLIGLELDFNLLLCVLDQL